jgi:choline kinase
MAIENAVILAAGIGSRLKPITDKAPKCLTEINGTPILSGALDNLHIAGVKCCTIVTGYLSGIIERSIGNSHRGIEIQFIKNDRFEETNDMYSLWLARGIMEKGAVILEGDIFFKSQTLKKAITVMGDNSFYVAGKYNGTYDEVLIKTGPDRVVKSIDVMRNRREEENDLHFMSTGMLIIQQDYSKLFSRWLKKFVIKNNVDVLFDDVLSAHVGDANLHVFEISQSEWVEIDTKEDIKRAEKMFC